MGLGLKENQLKINFESIEFQGSYGEKILASNIQSIELVKELPKISLKTNGFALGSVKKGFFKTEEGEKIKLIINAEQSSVLLITKKNGQKIYYSAKNESNFNIVSELKNKLPELHYR